MGKLGGKVAVITGGATGIGLAAAKRFIEEGRSGATLTHRPRGRWISVRSPNSTGAVA